MWILGMRVKVMPAHIVSAERAEVSVGSVEVRSQIMLWVREQTVRALVGLFGYEFVCEQTPTN